MMFLANEFVYFSIVCRGLMGKAGVDSFIVSVYHGIS